MIRISQLKLHPDHTPEELEREVRRILRLRDNEKTDIHIRRQSVDARKKPDIFYIYTVDVETGNDAKILGHPAVRRNRNVSAVRIREYHFPAVNTAAVRRTDPDLRPVIVGSGPAGMFCALLLARSALRPIILERGEDVDARTRSVDHLWECGELNTESNVQFGEGGAGTFSDGKLNTMIKDPEGRIRFVLETFVRFGADPSILYSFKPHVGTDVLKKVVKNIRYEIESLGGEYRFGSRLDDLRKNTDGTYDLTVCSTADGDKKIQYLRTDILVLAVGHSARDTFAMLKEHHFAMNPKAFAVGLRVQHPQRMIDEQMYGRFCPYELPPSSYKVTHQAKDGHGVYSFCMCPGGYVVNASSEKGRLAVNGMSYSRRDGENANSAIVVTVSPEDYAIGPASKEDPLCGVAFQRKLEERACALAQGKIPVQRFEDFCAGQASTKTGSVSPQIRGLWQLSNVRKILPEAVNADIEEGMKSFSHSIAGFDGDDVLLCGVESRTSSPVRIERNPDTLQAVNYAGIYPCGEGAGYAGGITSAAVDGIRISEAIIKFIQADELRIDFKNK